MRRANYFYNLFNFCSNTSNIKFNPYSSDKDFAIFSRFFDYLATLKKVKLWSFIMILQILVNTVSIILYYSFSSLFCRVKLAETGYLFI